MKNWLADSNSRELERKFSFLVDVIAAGLNYEDSSLAMDLIADLSDKQWEKYEVLSDELRYNIGNAIFRIWERDSVDSTEKMIGVVAKLGLGDAWTRITKLSPEELRSEVVEAIAAAITEFGHNVNDPYSGMR